MTSLIRIDTINDEVVKPIPQYAGGNLDTRPVKGAQICSEPYANIFLVARKKSGKTSAVFKILKECAGRDTKIIAFVSTLNKDQNWKNIKSYFDNKGITFIGYTSLKEDGPDRLQELIKHLETEAEHEEEQEDVPKVGKGLRFNEPEEEEESKPRKLKYLAPDYIIVLDDLSTELKSKSLVSLLKKNRHYKSKIIISSQYLHDVDPQARKQIDVWIVFGGQSDEKLQIIFKDADLSIPFELFKKIYKFATMKPFSFLYLDTTKEEFRVNFNRIVTLPKESQ